MMLIARRVTVGAVLAALSACSSGSGGTDVTIGSGQDADPVTLDFPVFYVKRPVPDADRMTASDDVRRLLRFEIGADLYMRDRASASSEEVNLTAAITAGLGDVRDVAVDFSGTKVLFAMRAQFIENAAEEDQPTWNIWEYDAANAVLRRVIASNTIAEEGHDIMPQYLPDGRIVFSSTRQRTSRAMLLDENKPQFAAQVEDSVNEPAFLLHVMEADGTGIRQISFNQSHDLHPAVLPNGQIVFTRWENAGGKSQMDLFRVNPDGSGLELLYGARSHATGTPRADGTPSTIQFLSPRAMPDGRTLAIVRPFTGTGDGGALVLIDTEVFVENTQPIQANAGLPGPAQQRALPTDVRTIPGPSPGGRYRSAAPLFDGTDRLLVSWSPCRLLEEDGRIVPCTADRLNDGADSLVEAPPLYGIFVYDVRTNTQQPVVAPEEGVIYTDIVAGAPRSLPPVLLDRVAGVDYSPALAEENVGIVKIGSVYDIHGADTAPGGIEAVRNPAAPAFAQRPARFLRIEKAVSQPDDDVRDVPAQAFGPNRGLGMRDILGYVPIEPDGSAVFKMPANVAFMISILDRNGRRITSGPGNSPRHQSWLQVTPGEVLTCNGCHNPGLSPPVSHGRRDAFAAANPGAPTTGQPFPNTNAALFANMGETMAETRGRIMCNGACAPSIDILVDDYWRVTPDPSDPNETFDYCYSIGPTGVPSDPADPSTARHTCSTSLATEAPAPEPCSRNWNSGCRITIHYPQHIHPLWSRDRGANTCTNCHAPPDVTGAAEPPAAHLDLSDGPSADQPYHLNAYRQLLFTRTEKELDENGNLVDVLVEVGTDPVTGEPLYATVPVPAPMSANGARASARFFGPFDNGGGDVDHRGFLEPAELRLLAEWLDIGAQYYNDPFVAPEN